MPIGFRLSLGLFTVAASASGVLGQDRTCVVSRISDGDTFHCEGGDVVRLTLVDAPESDDLPFGTAARAALETLAPLGTTLRLVLDVAERDRFGRLLAYAYLSDGRMLNEELVLQGWALPMVIPPNVRHVERMRAAAQSARARASGLWETFPADPCEPAYPEYCIPPPPPDLDCEQIRFRYFEVRAPDPHRFDTDGDGIGCEQPAEGAAEPLVRDQKAPPNPSLCNEWTSPNPLRSGSS